MSKVFKIGTRASTMAVRQTEAVMDALQRRFPDHRFEMVTRQADADKDLKSRLSALGGKGGAFINAMREMMLTGTADMAMHSLKDLPGDETYYSEPDFMIGACLPRSDARDALVLKAAADGKGIASTTNPGAALPAVPPEVIGTSSVRRTAYLRRLYPESRVVPFRGAADKRIERLDSGTSMVFNYGGRTPPIDALVLAKAGLERIGMGERISGVFPVNEMCPAVGQGVVVVEHATRNAEVGALLAAINDPKTTYCYQAERSLLRTLQGHCDSPIGGHAWISHGKLRMKAVVLSLDGRSLLDVEDESDFIDPISLGARVGGRLNRLGAQTLIEESRYGE
jgi:hydroxymethylbilane synthase